MSDNTIYQDIATRTNGDIYIGVVGPVRTGKSSFIKRFMDVLVLPNIEQEAKRERAKDELPQSSTGRTIMTTEPKFVPEDAVQVSIKNSAKFNCRMIDCVGYIIPSALGYIENEQPRMVKTPWFDKEVPFNMAAEVGTKKVITQHSTIGLVVTTDGTISDLPRLEYEEVEQKVISELKEIQKPFVVLLNSANPSSLKCKELAKSLAQKHQVSVIPVNCLELEEKEIIEILSTLLFEFPIKEIKIDFSKWISRLEKGHWLKEEIYSSIANHAKEVKKVKDSAEFLQQILKIQSVESANIDDINLSNGSVKLKLNINHELFYKILTEKTGITIADEQRLMSTLVDLASIKGEYDRFKLALDEVDATGYGIVMPTMSELTLEDPEIMKQGGRYGVRLKASAPSIHMMRANINTEVAPIVGSESQSEELIMYLLKEFEEDPSKIWESNIFGKSLNSLVNEGLHNKLYKMPTDARMKIQETLERVINEGCSGLICIIL